MIENKYDYIHCPMCGNMDPNVERHVGDHEGTEAIVIKCDECDHVRREMS